MLFVLPNSTYITNLSWTTQKNCSLLAISYFVYYLFVCSFICFFIFHFNINSHFLLLVLIPIRSVTSVFYLKFAYVIWSLFICYPFLLFVFYHKPSQFRRRKAHEILKAQNVNNGQNRIATIVSIGVEFVVVEWRRKYGIKFKSKLKFEQWSGFQFNISYSENFTHIINECGIFYACVFTLMLQFDRFFFAVLFRSVFWWVSLKVNKTKSNAM